MRRTKRISKECLEVVFKDGKPLRIYPTHDWWHVFIRLADLEDLQEPMEIKEIHIDEYFCPKCGSENGCDQGSVHDEFCHNCGQRLAH